jgi:hypothetical protein
MASKFYDLRFTTAMDASLTLDFVFLRFTE